MCLQNEITRDRFADLCQVIDELLILKEQLECQWGACWNVGSHSLPGTKPQLEHRSESVHIIEYWLTLHEPSQGTLLSSTSAQQSLSATPTFQSL